MLKPILLPLVLVASSLALAKANDPEAFRHQQPEPSKPRDFNLPEVQTFKLANGIDVYLVENHTLPIVSADLHFVGGTIYDPADKPGRAEVCMELFGRGAKGFDYIKWQEQLRDKAATISSEAYTESQGLYVASLTNEFPETLRLFKKLIVAPALDKSEFERIIKTKLADLKQEKASARSVAFRVGDSVLYGLDHPIGRIIKEDDLNKLNVADCESYLKTSLKPQGAKLFVAGDLTRKQVSDYFGDIKGWQGSGLKEVKLPQPKDREGTIFFVDVPGSEQSYVGLKDFGPQRLDPDYFASMLMSKVLGGGFAGRLNMNLREDKGYSYGAYGGFRYRKSFGEFSAGSTVRSDTTYQSVKELYDELLALHSGQTPIKTEELAREKNGEILSLPGDFATSRQSLGKFRDLVRFDLPLDYYNSYVKKIDSISLKAAQKAATDHLDPKSIKILVVGDAQQKVIFRKGDKDEPLLVGAKQLTLLDSLKKLLKDKEIPGKTLVVLDADGNEKQKLNLGT